MKTTEASSARWEKRQRDGRRGMAKMTASRSDQDHGSTYSTADFCSLLAWQPAAVATYGQQGELLPNLSQAAVQGPKL